MEDLISPEQIYIGVLVLSIIISFALSCIFLSFKKKREKILDKSSEFTDLFVLTPPQAVEVLIQKAEWIHTTSLPQEKKDQAIENLITHLKQAEFIFAPLKDQFVIIEEELKQNSQDETLLWQTLFNLIKWLKELHTRTQ